MSVWTTPTTRSTGLLVTAAIWNTDIVENLKYLKTSPVFDGSPVVDGPAIGIGVTPSGWGTINDLGAVQITGGALWATGSSEISVGQNYYYNGMLTLYRTSAAASEYKQSAGVHTWSTASSGTAGNSFSFTERMRLDASGNVGIGVTPGSWNSSYKALQIGHSSFMSRASGDDAYLNANAVYGASNWTYVNSSFASRFEMSSGNHSFFTAPSGTAGNAITWTERFRILNGGNIAIGATARLYLDGVAGTGDTYIAEGSTVNTIEFFLGNTRRTLMTAAALELFGTTGVGLRSTGAGTSTGTAIVRNSSDEYFYLQSSSRRFKENISAAVVTDAQLDAFMATTPSWWDYKGQKNGALGFIAEDLAALPMERYGFNPLVNYDGDGRVESNRDYALIAIHHLVIQRLERKIAALESRIH